jgi:hypothetical protein
MLCNYTTSEHFIFMSGFEDNESAERWVLIAHNTKRTIFLRLDNFRT